MPEIAQTTLPSAATAGRRGTHPGRDRERERSVESQASELLFARLSDLESGAERDRVRDELVVLWLPMAHRLASKFRDRGESLRDLQQVAAVGLVKAVDGFDPARGILFEGYAIPTITGEIKRHFRDRMWAVRVPRRVQELRNKVRLARRELLQRPGSAEPTPADIAAHTDLTVEEVKDGIEALDSYASLSLDAQLAPGDDSDSLSLINTLSTTEGAFDAVIDREAVKGALSRLPERERHILYLRFFEDQSQSSIGEQLGISQMHVSRLIARSCQRVRDEALRS
ncbi:SigB/SigF/SigG family RNA polymerase sigma factor [Streptomyces sp. NBC_00687]|uniref:SigB/SigF/SigG family RNA polymerase sigma factor n=1 Tax=Streptomyces sp. NBC_00687 TaxID=2975807 RepID=UPI0022545082|nr:SigB/SigF/SigG family RNA polymerase sigma factor [Streptomyces sp. NBC_00687]MCX4918869.1 SigB/SigF/SigG family RNA polymerase sigma factor [Streptomyces sp. NBC_00687]